MRTQDLLEVEQLRNLLASRNDLKSLKETYDFGFNIHPKPPSFWDKKIRHGPRSPQDPMTRDRIETALKFLPKNAEQVLDVGAGYGFMEELIQKTQRRISLYGIDISPLGIRKLRSRFKGKFEVADLREIPYPDNMFNAVFALEVLEHIPPTDALSALKELRRVLMRGGILIVSVPTNETINDFSKNPSGHLRIYTPELIRAELLLAGFKFIKWKKLYAFGKLYRLKSLVARLIPFHFQPNNVVIKAEKTAEPE